MEGHGNDAGTDRLLTLAEYARSPDPSNGVDDLIAGRVVVRPFHSALHGLVCGNVGGILGEYRRRVGGGCATLRCGMVVSREPATVVSADAAFWAAGPPAPLEHGWPTRPPDAAFEVVDTNEAYSAVVRRVRLLAGFGVRVLWVVDPALHLVMEFRGAKARALGEADALDGGDVLPGFACKVADLFG